MCPASGPSGGGRRCSVSGLRSASANANARAEFKVVRWYCTVRLLDCTVLYILYLELCGIAACRRPEPVLTGTPTCCPGFHPASLPVPPSAAVQQQLTNPPIIHLPSCSAVYLHWLCCCRLCSAPTANRSNTLLHPVSSVSLVLDAGVMPVGDIGAASSLANASPCVIAALYALSCQRPRSMAPLAVGLLCSP